MDASAIVFFSGFIEVRSWCIITDMTYRDIIFIVFGALGACMLGSGCKVLTVKENGTAGMGGSAGGLGMGGSAGGPGMGGGGSGGAGGGMPLDWWDPAWSHRTRITFQNAGGEVLSGFPVMIRLDASRFQDSQASPLGADVRFIDDDGKTILPYEIDRWMPGSDSFVWVRVPTIDATATDHIWLYYGNKAATNAQNTTAVWNDFVGVYHLSPSASIPTQFADSAGTKAGEWANNQPGEIVSGQINDAISLDGARFVHIGVNDNVAADPNEARTVEAWINTALLQDQFVVYEKGECVGWTLALNANDEYRGSFITDTVLPLCAEGATEYSITAKAFVGTWHYVTLVMDRPNLEMRLYVDGTLTATTTIDNTGVADGNGLFRIGSDYDGGVGTFVGAIDEVRVSKNARSAAWIAAQHKSMTDTFLSFTVE